MAVIKKKAQGDEQLPAKKTSTALAVRDVDPFADAGMGTENVRAQDLIIPRLTLLHEMSKATKKSRPEYIKGATGGMFCITSLQKLFDGESGIYIIPIMYQRRLIEWNPIDSGGGLVRMDVPEEELEGMERKNPGVYLTDNDTEVVVTPEYYALLVDDETGSNLPVVLSLTGKKAQVSKRWNTLIMSQRQINPNTQQEVQMPFWFNCYHMVAVADNNDKGDFWVPAVSVHMPTLELEHGQIFYRRAREFYNAVKIGTAKAADLGDEDRG
jgi:hypothetical protein